MFSLLNPDKQFPRFFKFIISILLLISGFGMFAQADYTVGKILVSGNVKTDSGIIYREITFTEGQQLKKELLSEELERSRQNILNTLLFNYVDAYLDSTVSGSLIITFEVDERWYLWPYPIFEHAGRNLSSFVYERDWERINYGGFLVKNNCRGKNETLKLKIRRGYREHYSVSYDLPYIDSEKRSGAGFEFSFFRQKQLTYATLFNREAIISSGSYILNELRSNLWYTFRNRFDITHQLMLGYNSYMVSDTIIKLNQSFLGKGEPSADFCSLKYVFVNDKRDSEIYPLEGYYIRLSGTGYFNTKEPQLAYIGELRAAIFHKMTKDLNLSLGVRAKYHSNRDNPFVYRKAFGYQDFIRGYELDVIDGNHFWIASGSVKFKLLELSKLNARFIPVREFSKPYFSIYAEISADVGEVYTDFSATDDILVERILAGFGPGINIVTYYDWVFRVEYSMTNNNKAGFFIHLGVPI